MQCPKCQHGKTYVTNSETSIDGREVIRRRLCDRCAVRWTTREIKADRLQSPLPKTSRYVASHTSIP